MGILSWLNKNKGFNSLGNASSKVLDAGVNTFVNPVARAGLTFPVSTVQHIQKLVPGGKTGDERVKTPFGDVKRMDWFSPNRNEKQQLQPGEAAMGAFELATSAPAGVVKGIAKPLAKAVGKLDKAVGTSLKNSAIATYEKALAPTTKAMKEKTAKIVPELLEGRVFGSLSSLAKKAEKGIEKASQKFDELGKLEGNLPTKPILDTFAEAKNSFMVEGKVVNPRAVKVIEEVSRLVEQFGDEMPAEAMRGLRQIWDKDVAEAGGFFGKTLKDTSELRVKQMGADAIRGLLAVKSPDLAKINKTFSFFKNLEEVVEATKMRKVGQSGAFRKIGGAAVGAALGSGLGPVGSTVTAVVGSELLSVAGTTLFRTLNANAKYQFAKALASGEHSIPRITAFFKEPAFVGLKANDFLKYLNKDAKFSPEEKQTEEAARDERIEQIRQRLEAGGEKENQEDPERQQRIDEIRKRLLEGQED